MTDEEFAVNIRSAVIELRNAVSDARAAGLEVVIPLNLAGWVNQGSGLGGPQDFSIERKKL